MWKNFFHLLSLNAKFDILWLFSFLFSLKLFILSNLLNDLLWSFSLWKLNYMDLFFILLVFVLFFNSFSGSIIDFVFCTFLYSFRRFINSGFYYCLAIFLKWTLKLISLSEFKSSCYNFLENIELLFPLYILNEWLLIFSTWNVCLGFI